MFRRYLCAAFGLMSLASACSSDTQHSSAQSDGDTSASAVDGGATNVTDAGARSAPSSDAATTGSAPTESPGARLRRGSQPLAAPTVGPPENIGALVSPFTGSGNGLRPYGSNLGSTFEHDGQLFMLLGDTWTDADSACSTPDSDDDVLAKLPRAYSGAVPSLEFTADPSATARVQPIRLFRDGASSPLGRGLAPVAGFSDGQRAYAVFAHQTAAGCGSQSSGTAPTICVSDAPQQIDLGAARSGEPATFDVAYAWQTNKFAQLALRTVAKFTTLTYGSDYGPGQDALLIWGRPGLVAEHGRQAPLYMAYHRLPLQLDDAGKLKFEPQYYCGLDGGSSLPIWSDDPTNARPITLDGRAWGDPYELLQITGRMAIAWAPAPISKWVMMYGGDLADDALLDPASTRSKRDPGAIMLRFADNPWGPFSAPWPHLVPGSPLQAGTPNGPGGFLYSPDCASADGLMCAAPNPTGTMNCPTARPARGWLSGPNIIDSYTAPNAEGGVDLVWNVSTWNPYGIQLLRTKLTPGPPSAASDEIADDRGLERLRDWSALPTLGEKSRYRQQSSHDRGTADDGSALSRTGNRDYNNFICASRDATIAPNQSTAIKFDQPSCEESYVRGAVMARYVGAGRHVRTWFGMSSLRNGPASTQVLRVYVDDDPTPRVEAPLAQMLDGRAGEMFAPPFGAGSPRRLAWYYPIAFKKKLIAALDNLGNDDHVFQCDVMLDDQTDDATTPAVAPYPSRRQAAAAQLSAVFSPASLVYLLREAEKLELAASDKRSLQLQGPATLNELRVRIPAGDYAQLSAVRVRVRWDGSAEDAIDVSLLELLGNGHVPPAQSTPALTSYSEGGDRVLALKLPMPFAKSADLDFENTGKSKVAFELTLFGAIKVPATQFGRLHVQRRETVGPTQALQHVAAAASGLGRLVGVCAHLQAHPDPDAGSARGALNALEGDVRAQIDGAAALEGTGTAEYADDVYNFADAPQASPFEQAWGIVDQPDNPPGLANLCRWHVLGTELDFSSSLELTFELGGSKNPGIVERLRTVAFLYQ